MNKTLYMIIFTVMLLAGITVACSANLQMSTEMFTPTANSTETPAPVVTPTESAPLASATPEFAPFCASSAATVSPSSQCQVPSAEESSTYCADKIPYNLILINQGSTYELLTKGFMCTDAGKKNDRELVACTGPMATSFEIKVCDPACVIPTVKAQVVQCPQDYNYNSFQGCCTKELQQINQNCMVFKSRTTSCVVNCAGFIKAAGCKKNSFACEWDAAGEVCQQRK